MTDQIVITEKSSQAKDVRAAVGSRYGAVLPAEGHLLDLCEPEDANPAWKRWSTELLKPEGLYGTKPATGGNKAAKLKAIRAALRTAKRVWLATDCDREGQLIGQEILEHCGYRGEVMRVMFTAQDPKTIRDAFSRARPNAEHAPLYAAAVARRQADQIYNLSLTRTATVTLGRGAQGVIGVGRVKTPTLAIACKRELEIRDFVPVTYFEVAAAAHAGGSAFQMRHAPKDRILKREDAEAVVKAARDFAGPLCVRVEDKRQRPPRLHDLPSLQKLCSARFGWSASRTLEVAQELYDGAGKKVLTYPRAEVRYLPESAIADVPKIVAGPRPRTMTAHDWLAHIDPEGEIAGPSAQRRGRLIGRSEKWPDRHEMVAAWYEGTAVVDEALDRATGPRQLKAALWTCLEKRRGYWALLMLKTAHVLKAAGDADWRSFAATAAALLDGRSLKKVPIMDYILSASIAAWQVEEYGVAMAIPDDGVWPDLTGNEETAAADLPVGALLGDAGGDERVQSLLHSLRTST